MTPPAGRLIALEGVDGCGKTTQALLLAGALGAVLTHQPGGTALGRSLRHIVLDGEGVAPVPRAEALVIAADKAQHVAEVVRPALHAGRWVVTDRFSASALAYQGYGQGLPVAELDRLVAWALDGVVPDLTVLVDVPLDVARARLSPSLDRLDRLERMDSAFFARVRTGYLRLAEDDPQHWVVVDGTAPEDAVAAAVGAAVLDRLGPSPDAGAAPERPTPAAPSSGPTSSGPATQDLQ